MKLSVYTGITMLLFSAAYASSADIDFVIDGKPNAVVVLGADASIQEKSAAAELVKYLKRSTGADFTIADSAPDKGSAIYIGQTAAVKEKLKNFDWSSIGKDGIVIKTVGKDLILSGDRPRGSIYAVISFLEDQLGIRWWASGAETVPYTRDLSIGKIDVAYTPPFMYREAFFNQAINDPDYAMHMKLNGHYQTIDVEKGGHYSILGFVHTFYGLIPPWKYFESHPEWFSMIDGKRTGEWAQLCLTNNEMKDELVKNALDWIKNNPDAGIISISQNDCLNPCQCDNCKALVKKTGGESGALITFVNSVAEEIEKEYPEFLVETLAYQYTRNAPSGVKPRDNVIVRLCSIECNFGEPLNSEANKTFYKDITEWNNIADKLYVWDYVVNFSNYYIPHPNYHNLKKNIELFRDSNVIGLFEQGDSFNPTIALNPLKSWVISKLMWNPKLNDKKLISEFMNGYFGAAGDNMEKYLNVFTAAVKRSKPNLRCYIIRPDFYNESDLNKAVKYFNDALADVESEPVYFKRVKEQQMSLYALLINQKKIIDRNNWNIKGVNWDSIVDEFLSMVESTKNLYPSEGSLISDSYREMIKNSMITLKPSKKPSPPASGKRNKDWVDYQENDLSLANEGMWVSVIEDDDASNGLTCMMPGSTTQWALQKVIAKKDVIAEKVDVSAMIKADLAGRNGNAIRFGIYDTESKTDNYRYFTAAEIKNAGYNKYTIENVTLKPGMYIYVAPCAEVDVERIYIDRIFITKSK